MNSSTMFPYKRSILGYPHLWQPPNRPHVQILPFPRHRNSIYPPAAGPCPSPSEYSQSQNHTKQYGGFLKWGYPKKNG